MKIRVMGTEDECRAVADRLPEIVDVLEVSAPFPNRGASKLVRVYVEAVPAGPEPGLTESEQFQVTEARHSLVTYASGHGNIYGTERTLADHIGALLDVITRLTSEGGTHG